MARAKPSFDLALVGHVTQDLLPEGWRPGGTAAYAARVALDLGLKVAVVTSAQSLDGYEEVLRGAEVFFHPARETTVFENTYRGQHRTQRQLRCAAPLRVAALPAAVKAAGAVLLGPVMGEVPWSMAQAFSAKTVVTACLQGWLRTVGPGLKVRPLPASRIRPKALRGVKAVFVSREDLGGHAPEKAVAPWLRTVGNVLLTAGEDGSTVLSRGAGAGTGPAAARAARALRIPAFPARSVDPTGCGDAYAAGFVVRYLETRDALDAAYFASATASMMVEQVGIGRVEKAEVLRRYGALLGKAPLRRAGHG